VKKIVIFKTALKNTIAIADYLEAKFSLKVRN
jgi:hypothetical protein